MIRFRALIKETGEMFEPEIIEKNRLYKNWTHFQLNAGYTYAHEKAQLPYVDAILMIGIQIGDSWHYENDVYTDGHGKYYQLWSGIGGWILNSINYGKPIKIDYINELQKIGHLWTPKIQELIKKFDPHVYSCFQDLGPFSEVMK